MGLQYLPGVRRHLSVTSFGGGTADQKPAICAVRTLLRPRTGALRLKGYG